MFSTILGTIKKINTAIAIGIILFLAPFFWFEFGQIDLGGDGSRLYFYDPVEFIKHVAIYSIAPEGKGNIDPTKHAYLVYVGLMALIKSAINSPHLLINIFNGIKLSIGFLSIYFIVKELIAGDENKHKRILSIELSAIAAGFFYTAVTGSVNYIFFWVRALHSHDQIFLNPLMFLLLMQYLLTRNKLYMFGALLVSFLFSTNFAMISAPPFFAFYPIAVMFLMLYVIFIRNRKIFVKDVAFGAVLFLGMQAFHLLPEIANLLDQGSLSNAIVFSDSKGEGINFFDALRTNGMISTSLFLPPPTVQLRWLSFVAPFAILLGFVTQKKKSKVLLLTSLFFLLTILLVSANITDIGVGIYRKLFLIPGFSMFRHFFVQWGYVFIFFYALLFGQSLSLILAKLSKIQTKILTISILIVFVIGFWQFLNGELVNGIVSGSKNVKTAIVVDPRYEETLDFIRTLSDDGKLVMFPLSDNFNQVIYDGINHSAYVGPSSISILTHKKSFAGEQNFYPYNINTQIQGLAKEKNYEALTQIFSIFNIRYIFYNSDPKAYGDNFPEFPFYYIMQTFPKTQAEYKEFLTKFPLRQLYENGQYQIFEFDSKVYRSEIYIPDSIIKDDLMETISKYTISYQSAFIDNDTCKNSQMITSFCEAIYEPPKAEITVKKINPTQYKIHVQQSERKSPFLFVFQNGFNIGWKLSFEQERPLSEEKHIAANKYANAWIISNDDHKGKTDYTLYLNLETQKFFWYGLWITGVSLVIFIGLVVKSLFFRYKQRKKGQIFLGVRHEL